MSEKEKDTKALGNANRVRIEGDLLRHRDEERRLNRPNCKHKKTTRSKSTVNVRCICHTCGLLWYEPLPEPDPEPEELK